MRLTGVGQPSARNLEPDLGIKTENGRPSKYSRAACAIFQETMMFRKIVFALAAAASLGAMSLAPSAASAHGFGSGPHFGGGGFGHHFGGGGFGHHFHGGGGFGLVGVPVVADSGCFVTRPVLTPFGYRMRTVDVCD
jgi:hypothetical protein